MDELLRNIERNSALLLKMSKSLFMAGIPGTSSVDLMILLKEERKELDNADQQLTQTIIDELIRRGAYRRDRLAGKTPPLGPWRETQQSKELQ